MPRAMKPGAAPSLVAALARVLGLAAAYYVTGKLGLLLAIPPGYATAIWPPSGIALAGLLLFGYGACPGICLVNATVGVTTLHSKRYSGSLRSGIRSLWRCFEEAWAHLGLETQRQLSDQAIARITPILLAPFSIATMLALRLSQGSQMLVQATAWYRKAEPTFADCLALVRRL